MSGMMSGEYREGQRVIVHWGPSLSYAARILEIQCEERHRQMVQKNVRVEYEIDQQRLWHELHELEPLDEETVVAQTSTNREEDEEVCEIVDEARWQLLELRCCYSFARLTDPARCSGCAHPSRCNYDSLLAVMQSSHRQCPVQGCAVATMRSRGIARDDALRSALAILPSSVEACWVRGTGTALEVRLEPPKATASSRKRKQEGRGAARRATSKRSRSAAAAQGSTGPLVTEAEGLALNLSSTNRVGYAGVSQKQNGRFEARAVHGNTYDYLGCFDTAVAAAVAIAKHLRPPGEQQQQQQGGEEGDGEEEEGEEEREEEGEEGEEEEGEESEEEAAMGSNEPRVTESWHEVASLFH